MILRCACVLLGLWLAVCPVAGAREDRLPVAPHLYEGQPLALVYIDLQGTTGNAQGDAEARVGIEEALRLRAGDVLRVAEVEAALQRVRRLPDVAAVEWSLYESSFPGQIVLVVSATLASQATAAPAKGLLVTRSWKDFPKLVQTSRSLVQVQLNGGFGLFNDHDPWFGDRQAFVGGNPLFPDPAGPGWATWGEGSVEAGLSAATQIADLPLYVFGSATAVTSASVGQDIYRSDTRFKTEWEKAYAGFVVDLPGRDRAFSASYGPQPWQLNDGFLFSQFAGGFNAVEHGATYLAARTALEQALLLKLRLGKVVVEGFLVDPQEYPPGDSGTEYTGINLQYKDGERLELGAVYYEVPESESRYRLPDGTARPREGLRTANLRLAAGRLFGVPGLRFAGEVARQSHESFPMSAGAWYGSLGYTWSQAGWQPSLTYRYAFFSGDDPATREYERFDAPQSSGLDNWLQGISFKKTVVNSNLISHRVRFRTAPTPRVSYTFDYFYLWADEKNNLGGPAALSSLRTRQLGQELNLALRWALSPRLFFLGVAGVARPGSAFDKALGGRAEDWSTVQAALFWGL